MLIKKSVLAMIALGVHAVGFAGSMGEVCSPANATVPCKNNAWEFGVQALYLNPSYSAPFTQTSAATAYASFNTGPIRLTSNSIANDDSHWGLGLKLEAAYHFRQGNDLNLNWSYYNHSTQQFLPRGAGIYNFIQDELTNAAFFSDVVSALKIKWNAVNLEMGQHLDFNAQSSVRFHGGFQYANIQTMNANTIASSNTAEDVKEYINISNSNSHMKYNGIGPRIGIDLFYNVNNSFLIYGKAATALLVGSNRYNQFVAGSYTASNVYGFTGPVNISGSGSHTKLVPELEAKAGISYTYPMARSSVTLDTGWMWANYFNAQSTSASPHGLEGRGLPMQTQLDFQIQGAYMGLKWLGDMS